MALDPHQLSDDAQAFLRDYVLATLTTLRADGSPHVVPVGFSYDMPTATAMIIAVDGSQKVVNADRNGRAVVSQVDGPRWLSFEGTVRVSRDQEEIRVAEERYARRYRQPAERDDRVRSSSMSTGYSVECPKPVKTVVLHPGRVIEQSPIKTGLAFRTPIQRAVIWWRVRHSIESPHRLHTWPFLPYTSNGTRLTNPSSPRALRCSFKIRDA